MVHREVRAAEEVAVLRVEVLAGHADLTDGDRRVLDPYPFARRHAGATVGQVPGEVAQERSASEDVGVDEAEELTVVALFERGVERDAVRAHLFAHDENLEHAIGMLLAELFHHRDLLRGAAVRKEPEPGTAVCQLARDEVAQERKHLSRPHDVEDELLVGGHCAHSTYSALRSSPGGRW